MNKYNRAAINHFLEQHNGSKIKYAIASRFDNPTVNMYLDRMFVQHHMNFGHLLEREFLCTDISNRQFQGDQDVISRVTCLNKRFYDYMINFIHRDIISGERQKIMSGATTYHRNDGIKADGRSAVAAMRQSRLCDTDTRSIDDPHMHAQNVNNKPGVMFEAPGENPRFRRGLNNTSTGRVGGAHSADNVLDANWYAHRPTQIRDDPVGEIGRTNADGTCGRNCLRVPSCPGCAFAGKLPASSSNVHSVSTNGQNIAACETGNLVVSTAHTFDGTDDTTDNGMYGNKFTGEAAEYSGGHLDRLLSTRYIQTLNGNVGDINSPDPALLTTFQRGQRKPIDACVEGLTANPTPQDLKLWTNGDGFVDQSNPAAMKHLLERRTFRSHNEPNTHLAQNGEMTVAERVMERHARKHGDTAGDQIPFYRKALSVRNYERNVEESVGGFETDCMTRGYGSDMTSLHCRIDSKTPCGFAKPPMPGGQNALAKNPDWSFSTADTYD